MTAPALAWSAAPGSDGACCWCVCWGRRCGIGRSRAEAVRHLLSSSSQPEPEPSTIQRGAQFAQE
jgi:hypothetical protein